MLGLDAHRRDLSVLALWTAVEQRAVAAEPIHVPQEGPTFEEPLLVVHAGLVDFLKVSHRSPCSTDL
jgi:hypothetical protein